LAAAATANQNRHMLHVTLYNTLCGTVQRCSMLLWAKRCLCMCSMLVLSCLLLAGQCS
jgi:hypothetical protein